MLNSGAATAVRDDGRDATHLVSKGQPLQSMARGQDSEELRRSSKLSYVHCCIIYEGKTMVTFKLYLYTHGFCVYIYACICAGQRETEK